MHICLRRWNVFRRRTKCWLACAAQASMKQLGRLIPSGLRDSTAARSESVAVRVVALGLMERSWALHEFTPHELVYLGFIVGFLRGRYGSARKDRRERDQFQ